MDRLTDPRFVNAMGLLVTLAVGVTATAVWMYDRGAERSLTPSPLSRLESQAETDRIARLQAELDALEAANARLRAEADGPEAETITVAALDPDLARDRDAPDLIEGAETALEPEGAAEPAPAVEETVAAPRLRPEPPDRAPASESNPEPEPAAAPSGPRAVEPVSGPPPRLPSGVEPPSEPMSVTVQFRVDANGATTDHTIVKTDTFNAPLVAAAVRTVEDSRFPRAASGASYKGVYTVTFRPPPPARLLASREPIKLDAGPAAMTGAGTGAPVDLAEPETLGNVVWLQELTATDLAANYPNRAQQRSKEGEVSLACVVMVTGKLACEVESETPAGWGFAYAALKLAETLRADAKLDDGKPSAGAAAPLVIEFRHPR